MSLCDLRAYLHKCQNGTLVVIIAIFAGFRWIHYLLNIHISIKFISTTQVINSANKKISTQVDGLKTWENPRRRLGPKSKINKPLTEKKNIKRMRKWHIQVRHQVPS